MRRTARLWWLLRWLSRLLCWLGWLLSRLARLAWNFDLYLVCCSVGLSVLISHSQSDLIGAGGVVRILDRDAAASRSVSRAPLVIDERITAVG